MSKTKFYVIDHEEATAISVTDMARDMLMSFVDDIIGGSRSQTDFVMVETDLEILHKEVAQKYKDGSLKKATRLFEIDVDIKVREVGRDK